MYINISIFASNTYKQFETELKKIDIGYVGSINNIIDTDNIVKMQTEIKKVDTPNEEFVYPPDESYIPTDSLL